MTSRTSSQRSRTPSPNSEPIEGSIKLETSFFPGTKARSTGSSQRSRTPSPKPESIEESIELQTYQTFPGSIGSSQRSRTRGSKAGSIGSSQRSRTPSPSAGSIGSGSESSDMAVSGPLRGIKVIEFAGLAPAPMCGMFLSDFGANVIRIDKPPDSSWAVELDRLGRGKKSIAINLKHDDGVVVAKRLCRNADVLIEPFRAGVMEKLGLGPKVLLEDNPRLVYARLTGFGQTGSMSHVAGHDINYLGISGVLSMMGREKENPLPPLNLLGDFGGGSLVCALGILMALFERSRSGAGQVIDANIVEGTSYLASFLWRTQSLGFWDEPRGRNLLDSGRFYYDTYKTKDNKYMAVGALEPQFYAQFMKGIGMNIPQHGNNNDESKAVISTLFAQKTQAEWVLVFKDLDACVTPIVSLQEAPTHPHNEDRGSFVKGQYGPEPRPAPVLSRTPAQASTTDAKLGHNTLEILLAEGLSKEEVTTLDAKGAVSLTSFKSGL